MPQPRSYFGLCQIGHKIYISGGKKSRETVEYDVLRDRWEGSLEGGEGEFCVDWTLCAVRMRYVYGFGGRRGEGDGVGGSVEVVVVLDTWKKLWDSIQLKSPTNQTGIRYGIIPLPCESPKQVKLLIFGGYTAQGSTTSSWVFTSILGNLQASTAQ